MDTNHLLERIPLLAVLGMLDSGLLETAGHSLKAIASLFHEPLHDASSAVTIGDVVAER
jgi:hypothetical protein